MGQLISDFLDCECSGIVTKLGCNVTHLKEGDRVCEYTYKFRILLRRGD